ncbi:MAG: hypothetical protein ACRDWS_09705, partial [Acidimicrobiia bacterium]
MALPIPLLPPVTTATLPSSSTMPPVMIDGPARYITPVGAIAPGVDSLDDPTGSRSDDDPAWDGQNRLAPPTQDGGFG